MILLLSSLQKTPMSCTKVLSFSLNFCGACLASGAKSRSTSAAQTDTRFSPTGSGNNKKTPTESVNQGTIINSPRNKGANKQPETRGTW